MDSPAIEVAVDEHPSRSIPPSRAHIVSPVFALVMLALFIRLALLVVAHGFPFVSAFENQDFSIINETTNIGAAIASGHGFSTPMEAIEGERGWTGPSAWISPVYPYLCGAIFKLFGQHSDPSFVLIFLIQCIVSALTVIPIVAIGRRTVGQDAAYVAAFIWAVFPWFSKWAITWIWDITFSAFLGTLLFAYALRLEGEEHSYKFWAGFGALWGFAILLNPALMTILLVTAIWVAQRRHRSGRAWGRKAILAGIVCLGLVSPWLIRNRIVFGQWVFVRDNFGFEFALGNFHGADVHGSDVHGRDLPGWVGHHPVGSPAEMAAYRSLGELKYVQWKSTQATAFLKTYPTEFLNLTLHRMLWFWSGTMMRYCKRIAPMWMPWSYAALSILLLPGVLLAIWHRVYAALAILGILVLYPVTYYITYSQVRYRHALEPFMLLLTSYAGVQFWKALNRLRQAT